MIFFKLSSPEKITQIYFKSTDKHSSKLHIKNRFDVFQVNRYSTLSLSNNEFDRSKPWQMNEADNSIAVLRVMFDLGLKKNIQPIFALPHGTVTSIDLLPRLL